MNTQQNILVASGGLFLVAAALLLGNKYRLSPAIISTTAKASSPPVLANIPAPADPPPKTAAPVQSSVNPAKPLTTPPITPRPKAAAAPAVNEIMAWIYPGQQACNAKTEYSDGRKIDVLKPQYFTVGWDGSLNLLTAQSSGCNGYTPQNVVDLKKYSREQYATVASGDASSMNIFLTAALNDNAAINTLVSFAVDNKITGIEIDFEDFGNWNADTYDNYKKFIAKLGLALHNKGKKLMIDGPATSNKVEEGWYRWRYADFVSLPVDKMVVMTYDYQFDQGPGQAIAPTAWVKNVISWTLGRFPLKNRLTFGIASYAYKVPVGTQKFTLLTFDEIRREPGFSTAKRDPGSGEMMWQNGDTLYVYNDGKSMSQELQTINGAGINSVSVWHLGGDPWFY